MELKVGKGNDDDNSLIIDVAEIKLDIRHNRNFVDILRKYYEEATTNEEKRVIGTEINSINSDIKSLRDKLRKAALDSVFSAQELEAEISMLGGKRSGLIYDLYEYWNTVGIEDKNVLDTYDSINWYEKEIDNRKIEVSNLLPDAKEIDSAEDVAKHAKAFFEIEGESWFDDGNIKDDSLEIIKYGKPASITYKHISGTDEFEEVRKGRIVGVLEQNIDDRTDAISNVGGVWTDVGETDTKKGKQISFSPAELVTLAKIGTPDEMVARINDMCTTMQRYAFASAVGIIDKDGIIIDKDSNMIGKGGNIIGRVDEHGNVYDNRGNTVGKVGKDGSIFDEYGNMVFKDERIVGNVDEYGNVSDKDGTTVGKVDVVCNVPEVEIYDAFHRMEELETGVPGSGYEYMQMFLKTMFKYSAFEDDIYSDMADYDTFDDLLGRIEKEISSCSCTITDTHEDAVRMAFVSKLELESQSKGKGVAFMNRSLRNIFNCDTFEDHVYKELSEYEDPVMLLDKINNELSNAGVYDRDVLKYAIDGINRKAVLSKTTAEKQLDDVFGDHFTKHEYEEAAKHVMSEDTVVDDNISALSSIFKNIGGEREGVGKEGQIRAGKILEGITNKDYNDRWEKERLKMIEHGETKNLDAIIERRQLEAAQKQFDMLLRGIDDETMLSRDELRYVFESVGLQDYVVKKLVAGVTDIEYAVDSNIKRLSIGMKELIKKHDMYEDDIFTEGRVYDAVDKRMKLEFGDTTSALDHMKNSILKSVGKLDMTNYSESITADMSKKIKTDYGDLDEVSLMSIPEDDITEQFSHRIQKYREDAYESMVNAEKKAIGNLYAGRREEDDVYVPPEFSRTEMQRIHDEELEKARKEAIEVAAALGIQERLEPFISDVEIGDYTAAIPKKPKKPTTQKEKAQMKWWESYMAKLEPVLDRTAAFNKERLALVMRKGAGDKYAVFGEGGESVSFSTLAKLDKWFKLHYGKTAKRESS